MFCFSLHVRCQTDSPEEEEMNAFFFKGWDVLYTKKDSAYFYLGKAEDIAIHLNDFEAYLDILDFRLSASDYHFDLKTSAKTLAKTDSLLSIENVKKNVEDYDEYFNKYQTNQGNYYYKLGALDTAKEYFLELRQQYVSKLIINLSDDEVTTLFSNNNFLGVIYKKLGKYELSEKYFLNNRSLIAQHPFLTMYKEAYLTNVNVLLAQVYVEIEQPLKANKLFRNGVEVYKKFYKRDKKFKNNLVNVYQQIAKNYIAQDSLGTALKYIDESQDYLLPEDPFYKATLLLYGDIYAKQGAKQKALGQYKKALTVYKEYRQNKPHQDIAEVHGKIAELQLKQKNYQEGLKTIRKAFNAAGNNIQIIDFIQNPDPEQVFSKTQFLHLLDIKMQLLDGIFVKTADLSYQNAALQTTRDILKTFDLLKSEFDSKLDKQFLTDKAYPIFHRLLETAHKAYEKNSSAEMLQLALNIAEKNKDFVLLEALRNSQATQYGDVPKNVLEKEAQLRAEITNLEKQLFDATETEGGFSDALFKRKQEYFILLDTIKTNYPKYHELKYQNRTLDLATIRKKVLDDSDTLISYTMTGDYIYAIVMNGSKEDFLRMPFNETDREAIGKFYRLLSSSSINNAEKEIAEIAHRLFKKILQKPLADFDTENLTIIPDGELHYLPFDLLQENGSYLLETKNISYGNSVTSLLELKEKRSAETNKMLAFAPSFSGTIAETLDRQFGKLLYNDDEVQKIGAFYDTEELLEKEATLANFMSKTSQFNIFHLATHASANDEYPDYSYLAFTETRDSTESNILYIKDLYNISLNADMVTLSACQTGIGKLKKGQGMLSLSKGFYYAGAKSLVNTLWKINDKSTVKLMEYFYEGLSKGYSKSEALRKAKLKYLETTDDELLKHPYYWAAFVVSGDISPISNNNTLWWVVGIGVVTLLLIGFYLKKRFQKDLTL